MKSEVCESPPRLSLPDAKLGENGSENFLHIHATGHFTDMVQRLANIQRHELRRVPARQSLASGGKRVCRALEANLMARVDGGELGRRGARAAPDRIAHGQAKGFDA